MLVTPDAAQQRLYCSHRICTALWAAGARRTHHDFWQDSQSQKGSFLRKTHSDFRKFGQASYGGLCSLRRLNPT